MFRYKLLQYLITEKNAPKKEAEFNQFYDEAFTIAPYHRKTWIILAFLISVNDA